jgi:ABC-2 type transport system permease protein
MNRMLTIMRKEFIHIMRDSLTLSLVIIMPVFMLFLLGYAVSNDITDIPLAVADQSKTDASRRFIESFVVSDYFEATHYAQTEEEIIQLIDDGSVKAGLLIPEDFGRNTATGGESTVLFNIDGSDPALAQTAQLAAETISQFNSQEILIERIGSTPLAANLKLPIESTLRFLYNPDMRRMNFMIPGLIAVILQIQTLLLTAFSIVREREQGTLEQLIVTPIRSWELLMGKILPYVAVAFLNVGLTLLVGAFWFDVPVAGSIFLLLGLSFIFLLGSLGLGVLISIISRTQMQAMYMASFIMMPAFILTGLMWPRENMPWLAYYAGYLLPVTYYLEIVRAIIIKGVGFTYLWQWIWPMVIFSVAVFFASVLLFNKRLD